MKRLDERMEPLGTFEPAETKRAKTRLSLRFMCLFAAMIVFDRRLALRGIGPVSSCVENDSGGIRSFSL